MAVLIFIGGAITTLAACGDLVIALFAYYKNPKNASIRIFAALGITIAFWLIVFFVSTLNLSIERSLFFIRASLFFAVPMNYLFLMFSLNTPHEKYVIKNSWITVVSIWSICVMILSITPLTYSNVVITDGRPNPVPGPGIFGFFTHALITNGLVIYNLFLKYKRFIGLYKKQIQFILFGVISMHVLIIGTILIPVVFFGNNSFIHLLPIYTLIFVCFTSYAIIKHRFLDIHLIVVRSVSYALSLFILAVTYVGGIYFITNIFIDENVGLNDLFIPGILTIVILFTFQPMRRLFEHATSNIFYKKLYTSQTLLWNISRILTSTMVIDDLVISTLSELIHQMNITGGSLAYVREDTILWEKSVGKNRKKPEEKDQVVHLIKTISKTSTERILVFDEMHESPEKQIMRDLELSVAIALIVEKRTIGGILLGEKASGDIYSSEDIAMLKILGPEIAIAVQNTLSYDEIRTFNQRLQDEVTKATDTVKSVNEQMYTKNLELSETNKTLSVLRKIDDAVLSSVTDTNQIAQAVADIIVKEAGVISTSIVMHNKKDKVIYELATAPVKSITDVNETLSRDMHGTETSTTESANMLVQVITKKKRMVTDDLYDVIRPHTTPKVAQMIAEKSSIKSIVAYPLVVRGEVLGAMLFSLNMPHAQISSHKEDLLTRLVGITGIAIDNALLYQKIQEANERLKQLDTMKDEFVSVASHELRTPMTAIKSYLWLALAEKGGKLTEKNKFYLNRSYTSTNRLIKLVNDMLNVSRIEAGRMSFEMQRVDMADLLDETLSEVRPRADELGVKIVAPTVPEMEKLKIPMVLADPDKIKEVIINLVGNSLKFTKSGGSISIHVAKEKNMIVTKVVDTGEGIQAEDIPKLFQKFSLVRGSYQTNKQSSQGTGLGLYICKMIMKEHGGDIWAESPGRGKGATFSFSLRSYTQKAQRDFNRSAKKEGLGIIHTEID